MSIEFISAKDLPTTETEEIDVLCVENGKLKRKAANGLGGGGGYLLKPTAEELSMDGTEITCTANYDELAKVLEKGGSGGLVVPAGFNGSTVPAMVIVATCWLYADGVLACFGYAMGQNFSVVCTNGTYVPNLE